MSKDDKRDKFTRLANNRVNIVLDKLRLIGNLSDKRYYEYSEKDVKQIISSIQTRYADAFSNLIVKFDQLLLDND